MRRLFMPLLLLAVACASSGSRPKEIAKPSISIRQASSILFFGSSTTGPVTIDIHVTNNAGVPLRVREIELRSPGMLQYEITPIRKVFNEFIAPGQSRTMGIVATARARQSRNRSDEPLSVQAIVRFEVNGRGFREIVHEQFAGSGT